MLFSYSYCFFSLFLCVINLIRFNRNKFTNVIIYIRFLTNINEKETDYTNNLPLLNYLTYIIFCLFNKPFIV